MLLGDPMPVWLAAAEEDDAGPKATSGRRAEVESSEASEAVENDLTLSSAAEAAREVVAGAGAAAGGGEGGGCAGGPARLCSASDFMDALFCLFSPLFLSLLLFLPLLSLVSPSWRVEGVGGSTLKHHK